MEAPKTQDAYSFDVPDDLIALYCEFFNVAHSPDEFYISFFQYKPWINAGEKPKLRGVARIVLSPARLRALAEAIKQHLERYEQEAAAAITEGQSVQ